MNEKQAHKQAAKQSKGGNVAVVVYVFDEGYNVYAQEQAAKWAKLINIEATYQNGNREHQLV